MATPTRSLISLILCSSIQLLATPPSPRFTIDGNPVFGSFAYTWEIDELRQALDSGINLVFCYRRDASNQLLAPNTEMGRLILEHKAKVMANLCFGAGGTFLAENISADATTIQLNRRAPRKGPGTFWIGAEAIRFESCKEGRLEGCQRGWNGTTASPHPKRLHVVHEEPLKKAVLKIKDSPNLWGYWTMDDKRGNQRDALRHVYRIVKETDVDDEGTPAPHVVVAGMSTPDALTNFDANTCDMAGIYIYPGHRNAYHTTMAGEQLKEMLATMRRRSPDTPFMGIYQAFTAPNWKPTPKPLQVRKQVADFAHFGAAALLASSWRLVEGAEALRDLPDLRAEVTQIAVDLAAGQIVLDQSSPEYPVRANAMPDLDALSPVLSFDHIPADTTFTINKDVLTTKLAPGPDGAQWLHLRFAEYADDAPQWPSIVLDGERLEIPQDWSGSGWLVLEVHNYLPVESEIGVTVRDSRGTPFWAQYLPLPAGRTSHVYAPASVLGKTVSLADVGRLTLLMRRPPIATHLAVRGLTLAPARFKRTKTGRTLSTQAPVPPGVDAHTGDPCWTTAPVLELQDATLAIPPLQPVTARIVRTGTTLYFLVESTIRDRKPLVASTTPDGAWEATDDTIEIILRNPQNGMWLRHVANSADLATTRIFQGNSVEARLLPSQSASRITDSAWFLEASFELEALDAGNTTKLELNIRRHDRQLGPLVWAKDDHLPEGIIPVGVLALRD